MNRWIVIIGILAVALNYAVGCSGGGNPVSPLAESVAVTEPVSYAQEEQSQTHLWGFYDVYYDFENRTVVATPNRSIMFAANVVTFLNNNPAGLGFDIIDTPIGPDYIDVYIDVSITHPLPGMPQYNGYDVRGVFIADGSGTLMVNGDLVYPVFETDQWLFNQDGFTRWFNPVEFGVPGVLGYTEGIYASNDYTGNATLNPYKYFADNLGKDEDLWPFLTSTGDNGVFSSGSINTRYYEIRFPDSKGVKYGYAVIANWNGEDEHPSNAPESVAVNPTVSGNIYYIDETLNGGTVILDLSIFGWDYQPTDIIIESTVLSGYYELDTSEMIPVSGGPNYSTYHCELEADNVTSAEGNEFWVIPQYNGFDYTNDFNVPNDADTDILSAYFRFDLDVIDNCPDVTITNFISNHADPWWAYDVHYGDIDYNFVTIEGTGFVEVGTTEVEFDDGVNPPIPADVVQRINDVEIRCLVDFSGSNVGDTYTIKVTNGCGNSSVSTQEVTIDGPCPDVNLRGSGRNTQAPITYMSSPHPSPGDHIQGDPSAPNGFCIDAITGSGGFLGEPDPVDDDKTTARFVHQVDGYTFEIDVNYVPGETTADLIFGSADIPIDASLGNYDVEVQNGCGETSISSNSMNPGLWLICPEVSVTDPDGLDPILERGETDSFFTITGSGFYNDADEMIVRFYLESDVSDYFDNATVLTKTWTELTCSVTVPTDATPGDYVMRVMNGCTEPWDEDKGDTDGPVLTVPAPPASPLKDINVTQSGADAWDLCVDHRTGDVLILYSNNTIRRYSHVDSYTTYSTISGDTNADSATDSFIDYAPWKEPDNYWEENYSYWFTWSGKDYLGTGMAGVMSHFRYNIETGTEENHSSYTEVLPDIYFSDHTFSDACVLLPPGSSFPYNHSGYGGAYVDSPGIFVGHAVAGYVRGGSNGYNFANVTQAVYDAGSSCDEGETTICYDYIIAMDGLQSTNDLVLILEDEPTLDGIVHVWETIETGGPTGDGDLAPYGTGCYYPQTSDTNLLPDPKDITTDYHGPVDSSDNRIHVLCNPSSGNFDVRVLEFDASDANPTWLGSFSVSSSGYEPIRIDGNVEFAFNGMLVVLFDDGGGNARISVYDDAEKGL